MTPLHHLIGVTARRELLRVDRDGHGTSTWSVRSKSRRSYRRKAAKSMSSTVFKPVRGPLALNEGAPEMLDGRQMYLRD